MFKNTNVTKAAMAVVVMVGSLVGGVGCDERTLLGLASLAAANQYGLGSTDGMIPGDTSVDSGFGGSDIGGVDDSDWSDVGDFGMGF